MMLPNFHIQISNFGGNLPGHLEAYEKVADFEVIVGSAAKNLLAAVDEKSPAGVVQEGSEADERNQHMVWRWG